MFTKRSQFVFGWGLTFISTAFAAGGCSSAIGTTGSEDDSADVPAVPSATKTSAGDEARSRPGTLAKVDGVTAAADQVKARADFYAHVSREDLDGDVPALSKFSKASGVHHWAFSVNADNSVTWDGRTPDSRSVMRVDLQTDGHNQLDMSNKDPVKVSIGGRLVAPNDPAWVNAVMAIIADSSAAPGATTGRPQLAASVSGFASCAAAYAAVAAANFAVLAAIALVVWYAAPIAAAISSFVEGLITAGGIIGDGMIAGLEAQIAVIEEAGAALGAAGDVAAALGNAGLLLFEIQKLIDELNLIGEVIDGATQALISGLEAAVSALQAAWQAYIDANNWIAANCWTVADPIIAIFYPPNLPAPPNCAGAGGVVNGTLPTGDQTQSCTNCCLQWVTDGCKTTCGGVLGTGVFGNACFNFGNSECNPQYASFNNCMNGCLTPGWALQPPNPGNNIPGGTSVGCNQAGGAGAAFNPSLAWAACRQVISSNVTAYSSWALGSYWTCGEIMASPDTSPTTYQDCVNQINACVQLTQQACTGGGGGFAPPPAGGGLGGGAGAVCVHCVQGQAPNCDGGACPVLSFLQNGVCPANGTGWSDASGPQSSDLTAACTATGGADGGTTGTTGGADGGTTGTDAGATPAVDGGTSTPDAGAMPMYDAAPAAM